MMINEHTKSSGDLTALVKTKNISLPTIQKEYSLTGQEKFEKL